MFYALIKNKNDIFLYLYAVITAMLIIGLPMIVDANNLGLQRYFIRGILGNNLDLTGSLGYTGVTVFFISFSILIALFFIDSNKTAFRKIVLAGFLILNFFVLILANSRGGLLAAFISGSFVLFILNKKLFTRLTLSFILIVIVLFIILPEVSNIINLYLRWDTLEDREKYWQIGISMIQDHKIFGVGSDVFDKYFTSYASYSHLQSFKITSNIFGKPHPHNFFIFFTAENGILGFISAISFFILFFSLAIKTLKRSKYINKDFYVLSTVITGVGLGIFFRSFIEISGVLTYGYITRDLPFWILMVILIHIYIKNLGEERILNSQIHSNDR
jgi:O-antigen ligase